MKSLRRPTCRRVASSALLLVVALALLAGCRSDEDASIGETVEVGDLDLVVTEVERLESGTYALFTDANVRVRVTATNVRGDEGEQYRLAPFSAFRLDDDSGVGHDPRVCAGCEEGIEPLDLNRGGTVSGWLYFELEPGRVAENLRYSAPFSRNRARIHLD